VLHTPTIHVARDATHLAWDPAIPPVATVSSGDIVGFDCLDASNGQLLGSVNIGSMPTEVLPAARTEMSDFAPRIITIKINPEKIRDIIGKGGSTIRAIVEQTGAQIDIDDDGSVRIYAADAAAKDAAVNRVMEIAADAEIGKVYRGRVERIVDFGAFINILPGKDGLVHISQIADERVEKVTDYLKEGQEVDVVVLDVDQRGRVKLSMKEVPKQAAG